MARHIHIHFGARASRDQSLGEAMGRGRQALTEFIPGGSDSRRRRGDRRPRDGSFGRTFRGGSEEEIEGETKEREPLRDRARRTRR
jgi:hypothetical protein